MPYSEASYAEVRRWMEGTEIQYVALAKKAGREASARYALYSKATTVGQALRLGSKPLDLVADFDQRILRRIGGPIREQPLDITDTAALTETDVLVARLQRRKRLHGEITQQSTVLMKGRLSTESGVEGSTTLQLAALSGGMLMMEPGVKATGLFETRSMVEGRSQANLEAASIIQARRPLNDKDILRVLRLWAIRPNGRRRSVMQDHQRFVLSENMGLHYGSYCSGACLGLTPHCRKYPFVFQLFAQWMREQMPDFQFCSIFINAAFSAKRHRDNMNVGPTVIKAFGDFEGGNLRYWANDGGEALDDLLDEDALVLDVHSAPQLIDGNRAHEVEPFTGEDRYSLVFFTPRQYASAAPEVREELVALGFPFPNEARLVNLCERVSKAKRMEEFQATAKRAVFPEAVAAPDGAQVQVQPQPAGGPQPGGGGEASPTSRRTGVVAPPSCRLSGCTEAGSGSSLAGPPGHEAADASAREAKFSKEREKVAAPPYLGEAPVKYLAGRFWFDHVRQDGHRERFQTTVFAAGGHEAARKNAAQCYEKFASGATRAEVEGYRALLYAAACGRGGSVAAPSGPAAKRQRKATSEEAASPPPAPDGPEGGCQAPATAVGTPAAEAAEVGLEAEGAGDAGEEARPHVSLWSIAYVVIRLSLCACFLERLHGLRQPT